MKFQIFNGYPGVYFALDCHEIEAKSPEDAFERMIDERWEMDDGQVFFLHNTETGVGFLIRANVSPSFEFIEEIAE